MSDGTEAAGGASGETTQGDLDLAAEGQAKGTKTTEEANPTGEQTPDLSFIPESYRGEFEGLSPEALAALEKGQMLEADYRKKTAKLAGDKRDFAETQRKSALWDAVERDPNMVTALQRASLGLNDGNAETDLGPLADAENQEEWIRETANRAAQQERSVLLEEVRSMLSSTPQALGSAVDASSQAYRNKLGASVSNEAYAAAETRLKASLDNQGKSWHDLMPASVPVFMDAYLQAAPTNSNQSVNAGGGTPSIGGVGHGRKTPTRPKLKPLHEVDDADKVTAFMSRRGYTAEEAEQSYHGGG